MAKEKFAKSRTERGAIGHVVWQDEFDGGDHQDFGRARRRDYTARPERQGAGGKGARHKIDGARRVRAAAALRAFVARGTPIVKHDYRPRRWMAPYGGERADGRCSRPASTFCWRFRWGSDDVVYSTKWTWGRHGACGSGGVEVRELLSNTTSPATRSDHRGSALMALEDRSRDRQAVDLKLMER